MQYNGLKDITLQQMEALIHLVEERSFSRAAKKMYLTQPALTKHIKNMEDRLGVKIVHRGGSGISVTREGKILFDCAIRIFRLREEAREKIAHVREDDSGVISVCASTIPATYILPRVLSGFRKCCPGIQVRVRTADSEEVLDQILNGESEIGFVGKEPLNRKIHGEVLWPDRLILAVPAGHTWWNKKASVTLKELSIEPFVVREKGSATRDIMESCMKDQSGLSLADMNIAAEMGSSEAVKEAVIAGVGVSILSIHAVTRELKQSILKAVPVRNFSMERSFYLIYRRQFDLMRHHRVFLDYVRTCKPFDNEGRGKKV
jgi:DNA-binding transcriptional LysR family regulator